MKLTSAPAVIHGCGVNVGGSAIPRSSTMAVRQGGVKNHRAGRNGIAAKRMNPAKTQLVAVPRENCGGRVIKKSPSNATTMPSAHFCVPPAKKQASTGKSAIALLRKNSLPEIVRERWRRRDCAGARDITRKK